MTLQHLMNRESELAGGGGVTLGDNADPVTCLVLHGGPLGFLDHIIARALKILCG